MFYRRHTLRFPITLSLFNVQSTGIAVFSSLIDILNAFFTNEKKDGRSSLANTMRKMQSEIRVRIIELRSIHDVKRESKTSKRVRMKSLPKLLRIFLEKLEILVCIFVSSENFENQYSEFWAISV